jgi:hypothetical protein
VVAPEVLTTGHAEGEAAVRGGVAHRRDRQRGDVRPGGTQRAAQDQEQQRVGDRRDHADAHEARDGPVGGQAGHAPQVVPGRAHDVHPRVGIVDPIHRHLVDAQPAPLGQHEQLGVEEPALVAHVADEGPQGAGAHRLEAALRVGEPGPQRRVQDAVVGARDQLALGAAHDPGAVGQAGADGQVGVPGEQRGDERQQPAQVGREVDVHVADDGGVAARPGGAQGAPAALGLQPQDPHAGQGLGQGRGDEGRRIRAGVVGHDDPPGEGHLVGEEAVQAAHRVLQHVLLVVDRDDDLDLGGRLAEGIEGTQVGRLARRAEGLCVHALIVGGGRRRKVGIT